MMKIYLQDTPDFLRTIEKVNDENVLPNNTILVTVDVTGLFTNIPQDEGLDSVFEALEERDNKNIPSGYITRLLEIVLKNNIFEFNNELYIQLIGTAMGSRPAPPYANIFMARKIDNIIRHIADLYQMYRRLALKLFKRFLDDIFFIFIGSTSELHNFFTDINKIHPNIKFTMSHTTPDSELSEQLCTCNVQTHIPFLDTSCTVKNGKIILDLYRKKTDKNQYLLPSSCHPMSCTKSIPYSLATRINRICSERETRDRRFEELKLMLLERHYDIDTINSAICKASKIPRLEAIKYVHREKNKNQPIFAINFDPRLPSIKDIQIKHWRSMISQDQYLREVFPQPPLTAFKRPKNLRDLLINAKIPTLTKQRPERKIKGMKKCNNLCSACPFVDERKIIHESNFNWTISKKVDCNTSNVIYMIICTKAGCNMRYIGETERELRKRFSDHKGYIENKHLNTVTGFHFNSVGHSLDNVKILIIEKVRKLDTQYRKERETYLINKFNTMYEGLNKKS